jgi:hypothetical protein
MEIHELVIEMKLLERRLTVYEEKYGALSEDFYAALTAVIISSGSWELKKSSTCNVMTAKPRCIKCARYALSS